jgi:hypothetical protein
MLNLNMSATWNALYFSTNFECHNDLHSRTEGVTYIVILTTRYKLILILPGSMFPLLSIEF